MAVPLNLANIQGDILIGLPKKTQLFYFFQIGDNIERFRSQLADLLPLITTSEQAKNDRTEIRQFKVAASLKADAGDGETAHPKFLPVAGANVSFSNKGLVKIGLNTNGDDINDSNFTRGMRTGAFSLGDKGATEDGSGIPEWDAAFLGDIDGVILITGDSHFRINEKLDEVKAIFAGGGVKEVTTLVGDVRPGNQAGHEHFGYKDGISEPTIRGTGIDPPPGPEQNIAGPELVLLGHDAKPRPDWAVDGSFLVFRKLPQLVPEFNKFLVENAPQLPDPTINAADVLGSRFVGRWKSGAPITDAPLKDDPDLGNDAQRNNIFTFDTGSQAKCPFAAHIRKMNPRADLTPAQIQPHLVARRGIPFGPEVTYEEEALNTTQKERGLYFVCYQSDISAGFAFLQHDWANEINFPFRFPPGETPGFDPLIGQNFGQIRSMSGFNSTNLGASLPLTQDWVLSKGGEYFFSPSLSALRDTFALTQPGVERPLKN